MNTALLVGSAFGALVGLVHAAAVFRLRLRQAEGTRAAAVYHALWTLVLWALFGSYVLSLWVLACMVYGIRFTWQRLLARHKVRA